MAPENFPDKPAPLDQAQLGLFLAALSRELRGPLGPLQAALEMLKLSQPPGAAMQIMERQVTDLARIVDTLSGKVFDPERPAEDAVLKPVRDDIRPPNILVVDDNRDAAESIGMLLGNLGAEVRIAEDGPQALAAFTVFRPDIVFLDIGMPGMDGFELARRLRELPPDPPVILVALTGWDDRQRVLGSGFDHHLVKPTRIGALQALLARIQSGDSVKI